LNLLQHCMEFYDAMLRAEFGTPIGANESEICALEQKLGKSFAPAHRAYLNWMGQDRTGILRGSDWYLGDILENTQYLPTLLSENGFELQNPDRAICFFCHQGYVAGWYYAEPGATELDPQCQLFSEGRENIPPRSVGRFSEVLINELGSVTATFAGQDKSPLRG